MPLKGLTPGTFSSFPVPRPAPSSGSPIKSQQTGSISIGSPNATGNSTIAAVNAANSVVTFYLTTVNSALTVDKTLFTADLNSSTNILWTRVGTTQSMTMDFTVTEYYNVKSSQSGIAVCSAGSTPVPVTISLVNTSKLLLVTSSRGSSVSTDIADTLYKSIVTNATTLTFTANAANTSVLWKLLEFY